MKVVPTEPTVNLYKDGFEETDILQRKQTSDALSDLVNRIDDPLVIALDGKWGTGKTYFLKRWVGEHKDATTVYFDAFANDYISDPLPALVSELSKRNPGKMMDKLKKAAIKLKSSVSRTTLAVVTIYSSEIFSGFGKLLAKILIPAADRLIQKFWDREEERTSAILEFKKALESISAPEDASQHGANLVFVIDELDRCRPDYALEVLELIKHLFSVPRVHFVLGVNLEALENIVRTRYGAGIDAHRYLSKFIQVKLKLPAEVNLRNPKKTIVAYMEYLVDQLKIPEHISEKMQLQVKFVSEFNHVSLRDIGHIASSVSLASDDVLRNPSNSKRYSGWINIMNTLIISNIVRNDLYPKFLNATVTKDELLKYLGAENHEQMKNKLGCSLDLDYDLNQKAWLYYTWLYISQNKEYKNCDPQFHEYIPEQFSFDYLAPYIDPKTSPNQIPNLVHQRWLNRFSFYKPNQS